MNSEAIKTVVTIISCIISLLSLFGFGTIMTMFWKDKHDKKKKDMEENSQLKEEHNAQVLAKIVNDALDLKLSPIISKLDMLEEDMIKVKKGVQVSNRTDLEELSEKADKQGFLSAYDKQRFEATYQAYHNLGRNGIMDATRERILAMSETKQVKKKTTTTKKKVVLLEDK